MIKAVLLDFDGTLVTEDTTSVLAEIVGKRQLSDRLNNDFHAGIKPGITALIERINLLAGVSRQQIDAKLGEADYLMPGAVDLLKYLRDRDIITILASGAILPILEYYQKKLPVDYLVGSMPKMDGDLIVGIAEADFPQMPFKLRGCEAILNRLGIKPSEVVAIGDSPAEKELFAFAGASIAINPKGGIEKFADYVIKDDLAQAIPIIADL